MHCSMTWVLLVATFTLCWWYLDAQSNDVFYQKFSDDNGHLSQVLSQIIVPRVVGSPGHRSVREFIIKEMQILGFETEVDSFTSKVPIFNNLTFANVIATCNPDAKMFLTLACHYDSKYFKNDPHFVGAIDSAVPCAIMINLAKTLAPYLSSKLLDQKDIGLKFIFFDGEEAFLDWNEKDSVYGSRHLAKKMSKSLSTVRGRQIRNIDRIEVLVLLDLIGAANPKFYSFYPNTENLHFSLNAIENALYKRGELEGHNQMFMKTFSTSFIDDDHRPFLQKNVPILHLITIPFPKQWHKPDDTPDNLHWPSIRNFNKILRVFVNEYLERHTDDINFRS